MEKPTTRLLADAEEVVQVEGAPKALPDHHRVRPDLKGTRGEETREEGRVDQVKGEKEVC